MAIGLGATGKTTLLRWLCERALERDEDDLALATVDPVNRELSHYFPAAMGHPPRTPHRSRYGWSSC
jgi:GTPase SAR1 family protein